MIEACAIFAICSTNSGSYQARLLWRLSHTFESNVGEGEINLSGLNNLVNFVIKV